MAVGIDCGSLVTDALPNGIVVLDGETKVLFWNKWMERHSGIPSDQAQGRCLGELFPRIAGTRLVAAIQTALMHRLAGIVSPSIHAPPLPLYRHAEDRAKDERLAQLIHVVPIKLADAKVCTLYVQDVTAAVLRERRLNEQAKELAASNAVLQAQLDEIQALQSKIAEMSARDALTGVLDREHIEQKLEEAFAIAAKNAGTVAVALFDVDLLKKINETHGHAAGDAILKLLAGLLKEVLPGNASVGRLDEDSFLVVMPAISMDEVQHLAEQVRRRFADQQLGYQGNLVTATLSAGLAIFPEHGGTSEELMQCLDLVMFLARHDGYDRVLAYGQTPQEA